MGSLTFRAAIMGLVFGLVVGAIMRLPGADAVLAAFAINLSVMASLWLGASFAPVGTGRKAINLEMAGALVAYVAAGAALQASPIWLYFGFLFQAVWSVVHLENRFGAYTRGWFPAFACAANIGFLICLFALRNWT